MSPFWVVKDQRMNFAVIEKVGLCFLHLVECQDENGTVAVFHHIQVVPHLNQSTFLGLYNYVVTLKPLARSCVLDISAFNRLPSAG